ncbi:uncharacterized protein LOC110599396 isoform X2 [Ictidomys tridecemlineatus]
MGSLWRFYLSDLFTLRPLQIVNCSSHIPILACFPVEISIQRMCVFLCKTLSWITSTKKVLEIELRASGMQAMTLIHLLTAHEDPAKIITRSETS